MGPGSPFSLGGTLLPFFRFDCEKEERKQRPLGVLSVAGIMAINSTAINGYIIFALAILVGVVFAGTLRVGRILEDAAMNVFEGKKRSDDILDATIKVEKEFLAAPSVQAQKALENQWERSIEILKGRPRLEKMTRDKWLLWIQILFGFAILLLLVGYIRNNATHLLNFGRGAATPLAAPSTPSPSPIPAVQKAGQNPVLNTKSRAATGPRTNKP